MALDRFIASWAQSFYATGIGRESYDVSEDKITTEYRTLFEDKVAEFMHTNKVNPQQAAQFLTELKSNRLYAALYILPMLHPDKNNTDWRAKLKKAVQDFTNQHTAYFAIYTGAKKCFICYVDEEKGSIVGTYPDLGSLYPLVPKDTKGVNNDCITYLCSRNPMQMSNQETAACEYLISVGAITADNLYKTLVEIPGKGLCNATALDLVDIPFSVRQLIMTLPPAFVVEHGGDTYKAAYAFSKGNNALPAEDEAWLADVCNESGDAATSTQMAASTAELNDEIVKAYLVEHYGMKEDRTLGQLFSNVCSLVQTQDFVDTVAEHGAEGVRTLLEDNPDYLTGSFDELIKDYCEENNIDLRCSIAQLIHNMQYDYDPKPATIQESLSSYLEENPTVPKETTISELLSGTPHKHVDDFDICMDMIDNCADISPEIKRCVRTALVDETPVSFPTLEEMLKDEGLSTDIQALINALVSGEKTPEELSQPTATYSRVLSIPERKVRDAANCMLNGFRDYLLEKDTMEKRVAGQTLLYAYMKVLYAGMSSPEKDKEFLEGKVVECQDNMIKKIISDAMTIYCN